MYKQTNIGEKRGLKTNFKKNMAKKSEKILTQKQVVRLGLNKVSVITANMLEGYTSIGEMAFECCISLTSVVIPNSVTSIGSCAFWGCKNLTSVVIPNNITSIGSCAFYGCKNLTSVVIPNNITSIGNEAFAYCIGLTSVTIGDKTYEKQTQVDGKCKAYKGFKTDMTCRDFQYEEGKTYEFDGEPILCCCGFHASLSLPDVFNYYYGEFGKDVVIHEVRLEGVTDEHYNESKVVAGKITIGKRIL